MKKQTPEAILAGFEKRVDAIFRAEAGKPKDLPTYRNLMYDDGAIAEAHYQAWDEYFVAYCSEEGP